MFARSVTRTAFGHASQLSQGRRYATEITKPPRSYGMLYVAAAVSAAGLGYFFMSWSGTPTSRAASHGVNEAPGTPGASTTTTHAGKKQAFTGGDQGFLSLKLEAVEPVNHNTKKFRFKLPEDDMVSGLRVASAILTKFQDPGMEKPVVRPYTPISEEGEKGYLELLIKKYPNGPMSTHIHTMQAGQELEFKGPLPKYSWSPNKHQHIALIAGGTGITPMYQLCRAIFGASAAADERTKVTLVFGNIREEDVLLRRELAELENTFPRRFRVFYLLDDPPEGWTGGKGFVNKDLLKTVLPEPKEENIKVFVCGPDGLMKTVSGKKKSPRDQGELSGLLKELGYSPDQVFKF